MSKEKQYPHYVSREAWAEMTEEYITDGECADCECVIGEHWWTQNEEDAVSFHSYWELTATHRLCDDCYRHLVGGPATRTRKKANRKTSVPEIVIPGHPEIQTVEEFDAITANAVRLTPAKYESVKSAMAKKLADEKDAK